MFIYRRKRAMWLSLYRGVQSRIVHPIKFEQSYLTRKLNTNNNEDDVRNLELAIKIKERYCLTRFFIRLAAIISTIWSVFLLYNETMLIFENSGSIITYIDHKMRARIWIIFVCTIMILSLTIFSGFMTIFKLQFSDYLQLVPKLTDPVTFCSFTSMFSKVISVTCFNFMVMAGEVEIRAAQIRQEKTQMADSDGTDID